MTPSVDGRIRVLHSLAPIEYGGVERRHLEIVKRLDPERYSHAFVCSGARGPVADDLRRWGVPVLDLGPATSIDLVARIPAIMRAVRSWQPHIVHGGVIEGYAPGVMAGRLLGARTIAEETSEPANRRFGGHMAARLAGWMADYCVGVSDAAAGYWSSLGMPSHKVRLVTNGVKAPLVPEASQVESLRMRLGIRDEQVIVGSVGRFVDDYKRFSDLVKAVPLLPPHVGLLLVGDGPDMGMIERVAEECGLNDRVFLPGYQDEVGPYLSLMDVFALASAREAFGLVIAEAMFCSLPVVATHVGGIPSVVADGTTGLLVPPRDPRSLADALTVLVDDDNMRRKMGRAGYERAKQRFSINRYVDDVRCLYEDVLQL